MAVTNPEFPTIQPENYLGYSRGIGEDRRMQTLFAGAAGLVEGGIKSIDAGIQFDIRQEAEKRIEPIRSLFGVPAATTVASSNVPAEVQRSKAYLEKLNSAVAAGTVRESYYYGQLENVVKGLRSKYPGYNDQIDNIVRDITGVTPANALVSQLFQEGQASKSASDQAEAKWQTYVNQNQEYIKIAFPDFFQNPDKYSQLQVKDAVSKILAESFLIKQQDASIGLKMAQKNFNKSEAFDTVKSQVGTIPVTIINGALNVAGNKLSRLTEMAASGEVLPPKEVEALTANAVGMLQNARASVDQILDKVLDDKGSTYRGQLSQDQIQETYNIALGPITNMIDSIKNEKYGLAAFNANMIKAMADKDTRDALTNNPIFRQVQVARTIGGDTAVNQMFSTGPDSLLPPYQKALVDLGKLMSINKQGAAQDFINQTKNQVKSTDPKVYSELINQQVQSVLDPKVSTEQAVGAVSFLFGPGQEDFLDNFKLDQQTQIYSKMTSPLMSQRIFEMAKSDPLLWKQYSLWTATNFNKLFQTDLTNFQRAIENRKNLEIKWDGDSAQFKVISTIQKGNINPLLGLSDVIEASLQRSALQSIQKINTQLTSLKKINELNGYDNSEEILSAFKLIGIDPKAPKQGPAIDNMIKSIQDWVHETLNGPEGTPKLNESGPPDERGVSPEAALGMLSPTKAESIRQAAAELGISPHDLGLVIAYETGKTFDPAQKGKGPAKGRFGLIQFGPVEALKYGAKADQTFEEQMVAVVKYMKDRGVKPGMSLLDLYSTVNAGKPGRYKASDVPGKTVESHVSTMSSPSGGWLDSVIKLLGPQKPEDVLPVAAMGIRGYATDDVSNRVNSKGQEAINQLTEVGDLPNLYLELGQKLRDRAKNPNWRDEPAYQPGGKANGEIERLRKAIKEIELKS